MPEPPPNQRNICKKPKKKTVSAEENTRKMKKIRLIFSDPDATESSDDERSGFEPKRIVREINLPLAILNLPKAPESENSCQDSNNGENPSHRKRVSPKFPSSKIPDFRQRKRDRWAAETRDPVSGKRLWLGTFNLPEEASEAIERKKIEFAAMAGDKSCYNSFSVAVSENSKTSSHASPPCVLESDSVASQSSTKCDETVKDADADTNLGEKKGIDAGADTNLGEKKGIDSVELDLGMELDSLFVGDFDNVLGDFCGLDDLQLCGFEDVEQIDLPDFNFELGSEEFAWIGEAINIACTSFAASRN
ncbi:Ethylene-responsive transcription factor [Actinidia chinensis var. chinensis]|uniref:Ethylene-responsive transcription factor n=1 Tax=Actinidia chinensis var. chinensis TaxID=1590841 RepID=A0A2R6QQN8_ACTCC|nr:Ethylene-responsive transcription factor [Actinidia chinensis var. chinensis]